MRDQIAGDIKVGDVMHLYYKGKRQLAVDFEVVEVNSRGGWFQLADGTRVNAKSRRPHWNPNSECVYLRNDEIVAPAD